MATVIVHSAGTSGPRGNSVLNGTGAPAASVGIDGDWYLDRANPSSLVIYGPKAAGAWGAGVPFGGGGGGGSGYYLHTQSTPAATWQISHNLGRTPNISLINTSGVVVYADILHSSSIQAVVTFPAPFAGTAMCS